MINSLALATIIACTAPVTDGEGSATRKMLKVAP